MLLAAITILDRNQDLIDGATAEVEKSAIEIEKIIKQLKKEGN